MTTTSTPQAKTDPLTASLESSLANPAQNDDFDFHKSVADVLAVVGLSPKHCGGELSFHGLDPIIPGCKNHSKEAP
jgi:hypothetical protein